MKQTIFRHRLFTLGRQLRARHDSVFAKLLRGEPGHGVFKPHHKTVNHSGRVYVVGNAHTNIVESAFLLLKRGIFGSRHHISAKHLPVYLNEMTFRLSRRKRSALFLDTL
ncbi:MAG TPA: transposase [Pyrinomonadaceae bacterium]|nr:transposase [Pyrinomonadaceae bacterium]